MTKTDQFKALAVVAAMALALCLLAWVGVQPARAAFPGTNGKIIFWSNRSPAPGLYTLSPGGTTQKLPGSGAGDNQAVWSPDGSRIAFQSTSRANKEISVMHAAGTGRRSLTDTADRTEEEPAWSPDGTRIAFVANASDTDDTNDREIWMINSDGSGPTQLTDNAQGVDDTEPAWSPDGEQIAFVSNGRPDDHNRNIYVMDANPATPDALAANLTADFLPPGCSPRCYQYHDHSPSWSPDGTQITYSTTTDVWKMDTNPATTDWANLTGTPLVQDLGPAWSPNGSSIAYIHRGNPDYAIRVMDTAGLTHTPVGTTLGKNEKPDWQPDPPTCDPTVSGDSGDNILTGNPLEDEVICGFGGNDTITGQDGDILMGGDGNDKLSVAAGRATLNGGAGKDTATFTGSDAPVEASLVTGFAKSPSTSPLEGAALVGIENLTGSSLDDSLTGSNTANNLVGGDGADELLGSGGKDKINSRDGAKNDEVNGGTGTDTCTTDKREVSIRSCE